MEGMGSVLPRAAGLKQISTCYCSEGGRGAGRAGQALFLQDTKLLPLFLLSPFPPAPSEQIQCKGRPCVWRSACGWRHSNSIVHPFFFPLWDQRYLNLKFKRKEKPQSKCVLISFQIIFFTLSHRYSSKFYVLVFLLNLNIEKQRLSSYSFSLEQHKRKSSMCLIMS